MTEPINMQRTFFLLILSGSLAAGAWAQDAATPNAADASASEPGHFVWHELLTTDTEPAISFYEHVVGWSTQTWQGENGESYTMWTAGETPIGGVMTIDVETMGDIPPNWTGYISTADVDATVDKAKSLGGTVHAEPFDIPNVGRVAVLGDPQGAVFAVYKPVQVGHVPSWPPGSQHFAWNELITTDSDAAFGFYEQLFGWEKGDAVDMGEGWMYQLYGLGDRMFGGMFNKPPGMEAPPHWLYYVTVDDLDAAIERVKEQGGQIVYGPVDVPDGDRIAQGIDPQGALFALHESGQ